LIIGSVVPMVVEQDGRWERSFDIYSRLLRERIVFLGQEVNDDVANLIAAQLLHLDAQDPGKDIYLYVNSPGGSAYAGMAIYDAMQYVSSDVSTVCLGMGMSAAAMILCGRAPGERVGGLPRNPRRHPDRRKRNPRDDPPHGRADRPAFGAGRRAGDARHRPR